MSTRQEITSEDFELLLETNRILSSKLDLDELLYAIMNLAGRVLRVEAASVLLLDEKTQELYFDVAVGGAGDKIKGVRLPAGQGIAGWVAAHGKPVIVNDVANDVRWQGGVSANVEKEFTTKAIIACPLQIKGHIIGVVEGINKIDNADFTFSDLKLFEAFASQAAVAVDNARLFSNLRVERDKLDGIFNDMADAAVLIAGDGTILRLNKTAEGWFQDLGLKTLQDFVSQGYEWTPAVEALLEDSAKGGSFEIRRPQPKLLVLSGGWSRLGRSGGANGQRLLVFRDVTEAAKEEILKRNFMSMISHKLKTPLVAITGYLPFLKEGAASLAEPLKKAVDAIDKESRHLAYLVDDLLRFTTVAAQSAPVGACRSRLFAARLIEYALAKLALVIEAEKVTVLKKLDPSLQITGDAGLLVDMFRSLMDNAVKFNPKSQKILRLELAVKGDWIEFKVEDNGPGIPPEERGRIFQWFHQVEADFTGQVRGMGLGLAFVKKVAEIHGGRIEFSSRVGEGTAFTILLPQGGQGEK